jgi:polysaccharide deacetylase family protein (PEP-CTERM system associated)
VTETHQPAGAEVRHHFTVDVEEYFQVAAMEPYVDRGEWDRIPARVRVGTERLLDILAERSWTGTFFTLGWIAERHPQLVKAIADAGHEIASHGWGHERVTTLTPDQFRVSVRDSKRILEDISGRAVLGYRAPSFSIVRGGEWALDVLLEEGYRYDSSLFPIYRAGYGYRGGKQDPYDINRASGVLAEFPPATLALGNVLIPAGGGGYFRLLPYRLAKLAMKSSERRGVPATFYIHPWELDPEQPRVPVSWKTRVRHYGGLHRTEGLLKTLVNDFAFQSIAETMAA